MGAAASLPSEAADQPAKEVIQHATAAVGLPEAPAPADSPLKEEIQSAASTDAPGGGAEAAGETAVLDPAAESGEEEEGECVFCLYMMGGGCKDEFVGWDKCVEADQADGGDIVERCSDAMTALRRCMEKYPDYYRPSTNDLEAEAEAKQASLGLATEGEQCDIKKLTELVAEVAKERKEDPAPAGRDPTPRPDLVIF